MSAKRFVFSMEDGIPAMVERADGRYVLYDDFAALVTENERLGGITKGAPYEVVQALTAERDAFTTQVATLITEMREYAKQYWADGPRASVLIDWAKRLEEWNAHD